MKNEALRRLTCQRNAEQLREQPERRQAAAALRAYAGEVEPACEQRDPVSVSHSPFAAVGVKSRCTSSSCTGGPGFLPFLGALRPKHTPPPRWPNRSSMRSGRDPLAAVTVLMKLGPSMATRSVAAVAGGNALVRSSGMDE